MRFHFPLLALAYYSKCLLQTQFSLLFSEEEEIKGSRQKYYKASYHIVLLPFFYCSSLLLSFYRALFLSAICSRIRPQSYFHSFSVSHLLFCSFGVLCTGFTFTTIYQLLVHEYIHELAFKAVLGDGGDDSRYKIVVKSS